MEVASLAYIYLPHAWVEAPQGTLPPPGSLVYRAILGLWAHWDGLWYLSIASFGYVGRQTATAFFPLYPWLVDLFGGGVLGAIIVSLLCDAASLWFLFQLSRLEFGENVAWWTTLAYAFFPTAFYTNAVYSESLFLMLAIGSLYFFRTRRYWWGGPMAAAATLVSMYGILLAAPIAWMIFFREKQIKTVLHALWPSAGLLFYMGFLMPMFGDPLIFEKAQSNWGRHFEFALMTLWSGIVSGYHSLHLLSWSTLFQTGQPSTQTMEPFNIIFALVSVTVLVMSFSKIPFYLWMYGALAVLVPLSYPAHGDPLMSMPRLVLESFPFFMGMGVFLARIPRLRWIYFGVSVPLGMLLVSLFATAHWVA